VKKGVVHGGAVSGQNANDSLRWNRADPLLSSCPDAVTGVAGCWIVSLSRARVCRREALPFLLPLPPDHVPRRRRHRRRRHRHRHRHRHRR